MLRHLAGHQWPGTPDPHGSVPLPQSDAAGHPEESLTQEWLVDLMRRAGALTLQYFRKNLRQIEKPDQQGIVTEADLETESFLKTTILSTYPNSLFIAEESTQASDWGPVGLSPAARRTLGSRLTWIIDPIDGTTNFAKGNPYYCLSVAAGRCDESGRFVTEWGCVHQPATGDIYLARRGAGATLNGEPLGPAAQATMKAACFCTGFGYQTGAMLEKILRASAALKDVSLGLRINGAAALDIAATAAGRFDGFFEVRLMPWDMAAGALIAAEAGLCVTNIKGQPYEVLDHGSIIIGHKSIMQDFIKVLHTHIPP